MVQIASRVMNTTHLVAVSAVIIIRVVIKDHIADLMSEEECQA